MAPRDRESGEISDKTRITLGFGAAIIMVLIPLVAWAVRLELSNSSKVSKEQYIQDIAEIKQGIDRLQWDAKTIKRHLKIKD